MIPTDTYLKQPGARGRLGGARRVAQPSAPPSRPPFACDSPQRPAGKRDVSTPFAPGASPCLIGSPTPAFSSERSAAHVVGKENQGTVLSTQAQGQPAAASAIPPTKKEKAVGSKDEGGGSSDHCARRINMGSDLPGCITQLGPGDQARGVEIVR